MKEFGKDYSQLYDFIYKDKDYEQECNFIEEIFSKFSCKVEKILDLGCGTGGHALVLAKRGYHITGVDRSKHMLKLAKRKAKEENLPIDFIESNITDLNLRKEFDAVIAMFAVMSYQTSNSAIANVNKVAKKHLVQNGIFIFDCWHGPAVLIEGPTARIKEFKLNNEERAIRFSESILDIMSNTVEVRFKLLKINEDNTVKETNESHIMRYLFPKEIEYYLQVAGFNKIELCPFLKLGQPLTEQDWNMTVIARNLKEEKNEK